MSNKAIKSVNSLKLYTIRTKNVVKIIENMVIYIVICLLYIKFLLKIFTKQAYFNPLLKKATYVLYNNFNSNSRDKMIF